MLPLFQLHQQRKGVFVSWRKRSSYLIKGLDVKDGSRVMNIVAHYVLTLDNMI